MKRYYPIAVLVLAAIFIATTGFQCGSAELTSAKLYINQKNYAKAEESLLKELAKNDKNEEAWFLLGQVRYENRKYGPALEAFTRASELSDAHKPDITRYRLGIWQSSFNDGVRCYNAGKDTASYYEKSHEYFKIAMAAEPDSGASYYVGARAASALKDDKTAIGYLETALKKNPNYADAALLLGELHYGVALQKLEAKDEKGYNAELAVALVAFQNAYRLAPDNQIAINALIEVYERTKNAGKALEITRDAVTKDPNNKVYRYAYGVFLLKQAEQTATDQFDSAAARYEESVSQFKKAVEIDPNYGDANYNCGVAYLNWGVAIKAELDKRTEAKKGWKPKDAKEEQVFNYKEKFALALPFLEKAAETRTDDAALWQQLGRVYTLLNKPDKAKAAFEHVEKQTKAK
jgi:tetratricopeptide (TPR) repeat protein